MKVKILFISIISILLFTSIIQIFSIPPYSDDIFSIYKSGYFDELDREFLIIKDSFIEIKSMTKAPYGWIFLQDMEKKHNISVKIYDRRGYYISAPGEKSDEPDDSILKKINSFSSKPESFIKNREYHSIIPVLYDKKCIFCHKNLGDKKIIGVMTFSRDYDGMIYYSSERVIIFIFMSIFLSFLLYMLIKWDPERKIKELFDKI